MLTMHQSVLILAYQYNQDYITEIFCENKGVELNEEVCNGKCYLKKQINNIEDSEQTIPQNLKSFDLTFFCIPFSLVQLSFAPIQEYISYASIPFYKEGKYRNIYGNIFHPPIS